MSLSFFCGMLYNEGSVAGKQEKEDYNDNTKYKGLGVRTVYSGTD